MDKKEVINLIGDAIYDFTGMDEEKGYDVIPEIMTFEEAGLLTNDDGLVLKTYDGGEFVVTVQRRK